MSHDDGYIPPGKGAIGFLCANPACGLPIVIEEIRPPMLDANGALPEFADQIVN